MAACGSSDTFIPDPPQSTDLASLTKDDFCSLVGQTLQLSHPTHGASDAQFTACDDLSTTYAPGPMLRDPFRLAFRVTSGAVPEDALYTFEHPQLGQIDMFLFLTSSDTFDVHIN